MQVLKENFAKLMRSLYSSTHFENEERYTGTKLHIFKTNGKAVLLYGSETWKVTMAVSYTHLDVYKRQDIYLEECLTRKFEVFFSSTY